MDTFGCCSHYVKCSDQGNCLFLGNEDYQGCYYRRNLESGRIFYGTRKTSIVLENTSKGCKNVEQTKQLPEHIYISCYDRYFKIAHLSRNGWSYPLKNEEKELLLEKLKELEVPFAIEDDESKCIIEGDDAEPANSRVSFSFSDDDQQFSIINYNSFYIRKRYADGISKSLEKKGLSAKVELIGSFARVTDYPKKITIKSEDKISDAPTKVQTSKEIVKEAYKQISLFDFVS